MSNPIIKNKTLALGIIRKNFEELKHINIILDQFNNPANYQKSSIVEPIQLDMKTGNEMPQKLESVPKDILEDLSGESMLGVAQRTGSFHKINDEAGLGILPVIFIAKTVAEWSNENGENKIINSINESNALTDKELAEFILIRHAFIHRGNILDFESGKGNNKILSSVFGDVLPITRIKKGEGLRIKLDLYFELFNQIIKKLEN